MHYMLQFYENPEERAKHNDPAQAEAYFGGWNAFIGALAQSGAMVSGNGLLPPETATTLRIVNGTRHVVDGPFADSKEMLGARVFISERLQATAALWALRLDSELLFVGDAGNTEASRPSKRNGVEAGLYYFGNQNLSGELEVSYTNSRFRDADMAGDRIPGSIPLVVSGGLTFKTDSGWLASGRLRYFGKYPLIEDDSTKSEGSLLVNLRAGREWGRIGAHVDIFNVLNSRDHDVDYFYASRLPGEATEGVDDIHSHVFQPRSVRFNLRYSF